MSATGTSALEPGDLVVLRHDPMTVGVVVMPSSLNGEPGVIVEWPRTIGHGWHRVETVVPA